MSDHSVLSFFQNSIHASDRPVPVNERLKTKNREMSNTKIKSSHKYHMPHGQVTGKRRFPQKEEEMRFSAPRSRELFGYC
ncbi:MAG: hypothetical protein P8Y00_02565, partial [Deltaproteobacteria bacterium]